MAIQTITFHKRSTGKTGQVLASPQIEAKLAKVERLYHEYHGIKLGRVKFYDLALEYAREAKADVGSGYLQYTTQVAGIFLDHIHKEMGKAVRRKRQWKSKVAEAITVEVGSVRIDNLRDLARRSRGKAKLPVHPRSGKRILTPRTEVA